MSPLQIVPLKPISDEQEVAFKLAMQFVTVGNELARAYTICWDQED